MSSAIVVGAGVFGASIAHRLAGEGWDGTLVERGMHGDQVPPLDLGPFQPGLETVAVVSMCFQVVDQFRDGSLFGLQSVPGRIVHQADPTAQRR